MKDEIDKKIDELYIKCEFSKDEIIDVVLFARKLGFVVGDAKSDNIKDGFLAKNGKKLVIGINIDYDLYYKRYLVAYALGMYFLKNRKEKIYVEQMDLEYQIIDANINYFARSLLIDEESFKLDYISLKDLHYRDEYIDYVLSSKYKVPINVIKLRELDVLNSTPKKDTKKGQILQLKK